MLLNSCPGGPGVREAMDKEPVQRIGSISKKRRARMTEPSGRLTKIRVYYEDTDFSCRVYHASYLRFLERGRTEWLRCHGFKHREIASESGVLFAVRSLQIEYLAPALMDDLLEVETTISTVRGASVEFRQRITCDGRLLVASNVMTVALRDGRPVPIPDALRGALKSAVERGEAHVAWESKARSKRVTSESRRSPNRTSKL